MNNDYVAIKRAFLEWSKVPKSQRVPKTISAFAEAHNCSREVLHKWKNQPEFKEAVYKHNMSYLSSVDTTDIIAVLRKKALEGRIDAIRLLRDMGCFGPDLEHTPDGPEDMEEYTEEELETIAGDTTDPSI